MIMNLKKEIGEMIGVLVLVFFLTFLFELTGCGHEQERLGYLTDTVPGVF